MRSPTNEKETVELFEREVHKAGWEIIENGIAFPDATIVIDGRSWVTEFEYESLNFLRHKHDPTRCDLIICWIHNWINCPLPVVELSSPDWWKHPPVSDGGKSAGEMARKLTRKPIGRPAKETTIISTTLSLIRGEDDDLIEWFENLPPDISRAKAVTIALRMGGMDAAQSEINESTDELVGSLLDL